MLLSRYLRCIICLLLIVATFAVYWQVSSHDFVKLDDDLYVTKNAHVQEGLTLKGVIWAFTTFHSYNWHPLTWLSHMLDCQLFGVNSGMHHLTSLLLHIANGVLLFLVFRRMTGALWCSAVVAALFALHPLHVESVAWVSERKDVLSTFFCLVSMWFYAGYAELSKFNRYVLAIFFFALGLMAKPIIVTLPFVLLLMDYWPLGRLQAGQSTRESNFNIPKLPITRLVLEKVPFFAIAAFSSVMTFIAQQEGGAVRSLDAISLKVRTANALVSYVSYIGKMIWPHNLSVYYPHPVNLPTWQTGGANLLMWQAAGAGLLLICLFFLLLKTARKLPYFAVGWLWYLGTLVPMIGMVQVGSHALADRYTYIPLIGLFIVVAWGVSDLTKKWNYRRIAITMSTGVLLLILMACTWFQVRHWENSIKLYKHTVKATPDNPLMYVNLGITLHEKGRFDEAVSSYLEALRIRPNYGKAHYRLGFALDRQGKVDEAISHYSEALRIKSNYDKGYYHLGMSESIKARYYLGNALIQQERFKEAVNHFSEMLRKEPGNAEVHFKLGFALAKLERFKEAISHYSETVRSDSHFGTVASYNIACIYSIQNKIKESISWLKKAIEKGYNNWNLIKTDKELENIRGSSYYKELIAAH